MTEPIAYTFDRAAEVARTSLSTIESAVQSGQLRAANAGGSRIIAATDLARWIAGSFTGRASTTSADNLIKLAKASARAAQGSSFDQEADAKAAAAGKHPLVQMAEASARRAKIEGKS
jgi:excisionase family DNA binding protein